MARSYSIIAKPVDSNCNLACEYCYYADKASVLSHKPGVMGDAVLEAFVKQYIKINTVDSVQFIWHGGEPMLAGIAFFQRATELQKRYASGKKIENVIQTNGTLIDDAWCEFFKRHDFLVGISVDGPQELHDKYRTDYRGNGTFGKVMDAIGLLKHYGVRFNTLTVLNRYNAEKPLEIYRLLKEIGSNYMQFIPLVERFAAVFEQEQGLRFAPPAQDGYLSGKRKMMDFSITPQQFFSFYKAVFDEWMARDVGYVFVQMFEAMVGNLLNRPAGFCVMERTCGHAACLVTTGGVYSCDHFVYPEYLLGNIGERPLYDIMEANRCFGINKGARLPEKCLICPVEAICRGGCPKHRFVVIPPEPFSVNFLCEGYLSFYSYAGPITENYLNGVARLNAKGGASSYSSS
jgi:uncharacterized protein